MGLSNIHLSSDRLLFSYCKLILKVDGLEITLCSVWHEGATLGDVGLDRALKCSASLLNSYNQVNVKKIIPLRQKDGLWVISNLKR